MLLTPSDIRTIIAGALLGIFLSALEQTIVATALPSIAADLGGFTLISWVVTAYLLTSVCVTPIFGKLSDVYGRRRMMTLSLGIFLAGSALCALAPDMATLILARAVQGVGGGGLITVAQAVIADVVAPRDRGKYAAYFSGVWAMSALLGPLLGGLLAEHAGWSWIFWLNLPLGLAALVISDRALRKLPVPRGRASIDYAGILLLTAATVLLLLLLSYGGKAIPWISWQALALGAATAVLAGAFAMRQRIVADPVLPPRLIADRVVGPVLVSVFVIFGAYLAIAVLSPVYFQVALGVSASSAGLLMIPPLFSTSLAAAVAGRWSKRSGRYRKAPLVSLPFAVAGLVLLGFAAHRLPPGAVALILAAVGFGIGPIFPCSMVAAQNAVAARDIGTVSGAVGFARALGGAVATAAASALVLGLSAGVAAKAGGGLENLEELARSSLEPGVRLAVAEAFGILYWALAGTLVVGLLLFARVEDRVLHGRSGTDRAAEAD